MTVTITKVHNRLACAMLVRKVAISKEYGIITNVKLTRLSFMVWHIQFDTELRK